MIAGFKKGVVEIEQIEFALGSGEGRVEPTQQGTIEHFFGDVPLIDHHGRPLSSLGFVTCEGPSKLDLQRLITAIALHSLPNARSASEINMVL